MYLPIPRSIDSFLCVVGVAVCRCDKDWREIVWDASPRDWPDGGSTGNGFPLKTILIVLRDAHVHVILVGGVHSLLVRASGWSKPPTARVHPFVRTDGNRKALLLGGRQNKYFYSVVGRLSRQVRLGTASWYCERSSATLRM